MPVRFEKTTEYDHSYKWLDSYKNRYYRPSIEQALPRAGVPTIDSGIVFEPPLQRRKKTGDGLTSSQMFDDHPGRDDYVLLGDQGKFAPSVKYKLPKKDRIAIISPKVTDATVESSQLKHQEAVKPRHAKKAGDNQCPVHGHHSSTVPQGQNDKTSEGKTPEEEDKPVENGDSEPSVERSPPPAPRPAQDESYKRKPSNYISRPTKPSMKGKPHIAPKKPVQQAPPVQKPERKSVPVEALLPAKKSSPPSKSTTTKPGHFREQRKGQMNEFVQTDLSKGVADSGQEAPADYAMKYRAGIPPPRPRGPKRLSEYQMQYKWKEGLAPSPMLAAEQIIYNSNPHLAPYSNPAVVPKTTEYNAAFKKYNYKPVPIEKSEGTPAKKAKLQRSKSLEAINVASTKERNVVKPRANCKEQTSRPMTPDRLRAAGLHSGHRSEEDKRLLRESQNPTHIFFPHGKIRRTRSEYASNYKAPSAFEYEDGAWRGADPPHIQPVKNPIPVDAEVAERDEGGNAPSWYHEVLELRNKAAEYKMRARGTHFSRQHLAQLYAQQADLWDSVSNSSTLSALSLESASALPAKKRSKPIRKSRRDSSASTSTSSREKSAPKKQTKTAWTEEEDSDIRRRPRLFKVDKSTMATSDRDSVSTLVGGEEESEEGRVPTPKFRKDPTADYKWRHHLDRTTPAVGGALLTSPHKAKRSNVTQSETYVRKDQSPPKVSASWAAPAPTSGLPTRDSHVLMDEEASTDRTMPTKFTHSPTNKAKEVRQREFDIMPTLRETLRELKGTNDTAPDDDVLSMSARSVASSCSLASEVLDRARNRRDEFWGKPSKKPTRS